MIVALNDDAALVKFRLVPVGSVIGMLAGRVGQTEGYGSLSFLQQRCGNAVGNGSTRWVSEGSYVDGGAVNGKC